MEHGNVLELVKNLFKNLAKISCNPQMKFPSNFIFPAIHQIKFPSKNFFGHPPRICLVQAGVEYFDMKILKKKKENQEKNEKNLLLVELFYNYLFISVNLQTLSIHLDIA